jgi:AcrR family transcriptional regulator
MGALPSNTKGERTRLALIEASLDLFFKENLGRVSFAMIGKKLGVTQAALYSYFAGKEELLLACCEHVATTSRLAIDPRADSRFRAPKRLRNLIEGNFHWVRSSPRDASIILSSYYYGVQDKRFRAFFADNERSAVDRIREQILLGAHEGHWPLKGAGDKAKLIHSLIAGEMIKTLQGLEPQKLETHVNLVWKPILLLLTEGRSSRRATTPR